MTSEIAFQTYFDQILSTCTIIFVKELHVHVYMKLNIWGESQGSSPLNETLVSVCVILHMSVITGWKHSIDGGSWEWEDWTCGGTNKSRGKFEPAE